MTGVRLQDRSENNSLSYRRHGGPGNAVEAGKTQSASGVTRSKDGVQGPRRVMDTGFRRHDGQGHPSTVGSLIQQHWAVAEAHPSGGA
jgi:hypothetical protein